MSSVRWGGPGIRVRKLWPVCCVVPVGLAAIACSGEPGIDPVRVGEPHAGGSGGGVSQPIGQAGSSSKGGRGGGPAKGSGGAGGSSVDAGGGAGVAGSAGDANCLPGSGTTTADVLSVSVTNANGDPPKKGDSLELTIVIRNSGARGVAQVTPLLESKRFADYKDVPIATEEVELCSGETELTVRAGPFFEDAEKKKQFALGRGDYLISGVAVALSDDNETDRSFDGAEFEVRASDALLVPVFFDPEYFKRITNFSATPEEFLKESFTRPNENFTPSTSDPDGPGDYEKFPKGFDEMLGVRHVFRTFEGFPSGPTDGAGWCEAAAAQATSVLGLATPWKGRGTQAEGHGFDYVIGLTPHMGGGVACGWLDVQVSSLINRDIDRQQVILVHESGHIFGAPHCDDVGNGSGSSLQGYVMCSGEKHSHYPEAFVWHSTSRAKMSSHWD